MLSRSFRWELHFPFLSSRGVSDRESCSGLGHVIKAIAHFSTRQHDPSAPAAKFLQARAVWILRRLQPKRMIRYGDDTQSRNLYKKLVQVDLYKKLDSLTWNCTRFFLYKFLAPNTAQLYSVQETCMHVTRMVSSDWSAAYRCRVFILLCWRCWQARAVWILRRLQPKRMIRHDVIWDETQETSCQLWSMPTTWLNAILYCRNVARTVWCSILRRIARN